MRLLIKRKSQRLKFLRDLSGIPKILKNHKIQGIEIFHTDNYRAQGTSASQAGKKNYGSYQGAGNGGSSSGSQKQYGSYQRNAPSQGSRPTKPAGRGRTAQAPGYQKPADKYARGNNQQYMSEWSPEADHVDIYNHFKKPSTDGFSVSDLGLKGARINENDYADVV